MSPSSKAAHLIARLALKHAKRTCKTDTDEAISATALINLSKLIEAFVRLAVYRRLQLKDALLKANGYGQTDVKNLGYELDLARSDVLALMDEMKIPQTEL